MKRSGKVTPKINMPTKKAAPKKSAKTTITRDAQSDAFLVPDIGTATASLKAIPDGKVVDFITGRLMNDTPEEYVRQNVEMSLVLEYSYPREQVEVEFKIKVGSQTKRIDIAIFAADVPHTQDNILVIIETKREGTKRENKSDGVEQMKSYMAAC